MGANSNDSSSKVWLSSLSILLIYFYLIYNYIIIRIVYKRQKTKIQNFNNFQKILMIGILQFSSQRGPDPSSCDTTSHFFSPPTSLQATWQWASIDILPYIVFNIDIYHTAWFKADLIHMFSFAFLHDLSSRNATPKSSSPPVERS